MKEEIQILHVLTLFLLITSCNNDCGKPGLSHNSNAQEFAKIIPKPRNGGINYSYKMIQEYTKQAKLDTIENGFDSLFIRVWYHSSDTVRVLDLKNKDGGWKGKIHKIISNETRDSIKVLDIMSEECIPKSGWDLFMKKIFLLEILTLSDFSELPIYNTPMDGLFLDVEISSITKYRMYTYSIPHKTGEIKEARNIEQIMKVIENEFGILSLDKYYFQ